MIKWTIKL